MTAAVVTVVCGRHEHLRCQREYLTSCEPRADLHVVVAVDDDDVDAVVDDRCDIPTVVMHLPRVAGRLPIAAARNAGATAAVSRGADTLLFLDVDCLPDPRLVGRLSAAIAARPDAVISATVTYLPPTPPQGWQRQELSEARHPHDARPDPLPGVLTDLSPELFWSLCFAVSRQVWRELGGFYEGYIGYGAEDTDLGASAVKAGVGLLMAGGADAFHQHHSVSDPPIEHLDDIVRNSAVFARRHGRLPMRGWLDSFAENGLVDRTRLRRTDAVRVASIPPKHPYVDAIRPASVRTIESERVVGWEPDPLFDPATIRSAAGRIDVVHLHFGYDHLTPDALQAWLHALTDARIALVVTVHDLRNPHHRTAALHGEHLRLLCRAADRVLTLTDAAADAIHLDYGRRADVVAHPTLIDEAILKADGPRDHVLVPLKALRTNVVDPVPIIDAVRVGSSRLGLGTRVLVEPGALGDARLRGLEELDIDLDVRPYGEHSEICEMVADAAVLVLPYRFGTHSGWIELSRDLGTRVVAPDCGLYAFQWDQVMSYVNNERDGLDHATLADAVAAACRLPPPVPAHRRDRLAHRDLVVATHDVLYREVAGR